MRREAGFRPIFSNGTRGCWTSRMGSLTWRSRSAGARVDTPAKDTSRSGGRLRLRRLPCATTGSAGRRYCKGSEAVANAGDSGSFPTSRGTRREASGSVRTASRSLRGRAMTLASPAALGRAAAQRLLHRLRLIEQINYGQSGEEHTLVFSPPGQRGVRDPQGRDLRRNLTREDHASHPPYRRVHPPA
jgi:hypothetical protein